MDRRYGINQSAESRVDDEEMNGKTMSVSNCRCGRIAMRERVGCGDVGCQRLDIRGRKHSARRYSPPR
jgi:hypothetical protein